MGSSPSSNTFCEFIYNNNLAQLVTYPTHIKGNILDLVIANRDFVSDLSINPLCSLLPSDHFSITFTVKQSIPLLSKYSKSQYMFDFSKADFDGLADYLLDLTSVPVLSWLPVQQYRVYSVNN